MIRAYLAYICAMMSITVIFYIAPVGSIDAVYNGPTVEVSTDSDMVVAGTSSSFTVACADNTGNPLDLMRVRISASLGSCSPAEAVTDMYGSCDFTYNAPSGISGPTSVTIIATMENGLFDVSGQRTLTVTYHLTGEIIGPNIVKTNSPDIVCNVHVTAGGHPISDVYLNPTVLGSGTHVSHASTTNATGDAQLVVRPSTSATGSINIIVQANKANYISTSISKGITVSTNLDPLVLSVTSDHNTCKSWGSTVLKATVTRGGQPEPGVTILWRTDIGSVSPSSTIIGIGGISASYFTASMISDGTIQGTASINVTATNGAETVYAKLDVEVIQEKAAIHPKFKSNYGYRYETVGSSYLPIFNYFERSQLFPGEDLVLETYAKGGNGSDPVHGLRAWVVLDYPYGLECLRVDLGTGSSQDEMIFEYGPLPVYKVPAIPSPGNYSFRFELTDPQRIHTYYIHEGADPIQIYGEGVDDWTFMYYFCGDNNLADWMDIEIGHLEDASPNGKFKVYVFYDRCDSRQDDLDGRVEWSGTKRFDLDRGLSHAEDYAEPQDSGSGQVLLGFMNWAADLSPSGHYCLVLSDHGAAQEGICFQDISTPRNHLNVDNMGQALECFARMRRGADVLVYAGCHMASLEVADHAREFTKYQVFSQKVMWTQHGFDCPNVLNRLVDDFDWTSVKPLPIHVATDYIMGFNDVAGGTGYDCPVSIVDSNLVDDLVAALDAMCSIIFYNWDLLGDCMSEPYEEMWRTDGPFAGQQNLADLGGYVELVKECLTEYIMTLPGRSAYEAAERFLDTFDDVIVTFLPMDEYQGLNVFLPLNRQILQLADKYVKFDSGGRYWFDCLEAIYSGIGGTYDPDGWQPLQAGTPFVIDSNSDGSDDGYGFSIGTGGFSAGPGWSAIITMSQLVTTGNGGHLNDSLSRMEIIPLENISSEGVEIRMTAPVNGTYIVYVRVVDPDGQVVQETIVGNVTLEGSHDGGSAPVLGITGPSGVVAAGDELSFLAGASDPDGGPVDIWWDMDLRNGLGLDGYGQIMNWSYSIPGNTSVVCFASDGSRLTVRELSITIIEPEGNRDPVANMTWSQPKGLWVRFDASVLSDDPDGDHLQYRFNFGDGNMTGWDDRGVIEHEYPWPGIFTASLKVRDQRGGESTRFFRDMELVKVPNRAPILNLPGGAIRAEKGSTLSMWLNGSYDPDGDPLTVNVSWGDERSETFMFTGTIDRPMNHTYEQDGRYTIGLSISDGKANATTGELELSVSHDPGDGDRGKLPVIPIAIAIVVIMAFLALFALSALQISRTRRRMDEE